MFGIRLTDALFFYALAKKEVFESLDLESTDFSICVHSRVEKAREKNVMRARVLNPATCLDRPNRSLSQSVKTRHPRPNAISRPRPAPELLIGRRTSYMCGRYHPVSLFLPSIPVRSGA